MPNIIINSEIARHRLVYFGLLRSVYAIVSIVSIYLRSIQVSATLLIYVPIALLSKSTNTVRKHFNPTCSRSKEKVAKKKLVTVVWRRI